MSRAAVRQPMMSLRALLTAAIAASFFACESAAAADTARSGTSRPLNVIILLADDMGWGDLGCQGHAYAKTPAIDRLAATGCRLTQFYVTAPVCSSSRAGLLTGRIQNRYGLKYIIRDRGQVFHHLPLEEPTFPRLMKTLGYTTAHIGKWHLSFVGRKGEPTLADYGYDHSMELEAFQRYTDYYDSPWWRNGERIITKGQWTDVVYVDDAIDFIERAGDKPFFITLWSYAPHMEVECAPRYRAMYADRTDAEQYYYGTISQMDEQYGRLLDFLDRKGLAENTIVFFSSDNGPPSPLIPITNRARGSTGGLRGGKYTVYEGGIREPGIIRWPGVTRPGSVSQEVCWTPDILATISAAFGISLPKDLPFDGIDIRLALRGEKLARSQPLYWEHPFNNGLREGVNAASPGLALREGSWKLHSDIRFERQELYNLDTDMNEQWNLKDIYPEIVERMLKELQAMYAEINGPYSKTAHFLNPDIPLGKDGPKIE